MSGARLGMKRLPQLIALMFGTLVLPHGQAADDNDALQTVEVRGIRETLKRNLAEKRDSLNVVDSVSAEDLGKFPDKNVADSLQRVPGISVDRTWGEGRDIFVRGTDKNLNMTQLNGQSVASAYWWKNDAQSRGFNYDILPSELVGSLDVFKSPSADLDEGSIGGLVIVRTRKPLQFKKPFTAQVSAEATYSDLPKKTDPQFSGLANWINEAKTFGVLVALSRQERTMRRDGLENFTDATKYNIVDQNGVVTPNVYASWGGGTPIFRQDRERTTGNVTLQLRPTPQSDISLNYMNSDMSMDNSNQNYLWQIGGLADAKNNIRIDNPRFISNSDGGKSVVGGTVGPVTGVSFEPIYREAYVKSKVLDLEGSYDGDNWRLHAQAGTTSGAGGSEHDRNFWFTGDTRATINIAPDTYEVKYLDMSPLDASKLTLQGARDWIRRMESKEKYAQADLTLDLDNSFIKSVKTGLKFRDNKVQNRRTIGTVGPGSPGWISYTLADLSTGPSPHISQEAATAGSLTQFAWVNDALASSKGFAMYDKGMVYKEAKGEYYRIKEKISAAYVRADFYTSTAMENVAGVQRPVTRPHNADNGAKVNGIELQWQQAFGSSGLGTVVNFTYTDAKAGTLAGGRRLNVVGNSKNQLNASVFYEKGGYSARLSYNYRSKSYGGLNQGGQDVNSAYGQWDATANWDITPQYSIYASAVNLNNELIRTNTTDGLPVGVYENGARYSVGLRGKF